MNVTFIFIAQKKKNQDHEAKVQTAHRNNYPMQQLT